jgi:predicted AlkP superfamily phosphohydrolase/phosphomutase
MSVFRQKNSATTAPGRVVLVELSGASYDLLVPLAESGVMPHVARLLRTASLAELRPQRGASPVSAWTTVRTGRSLAEHGVLDDCYLDHRRGRIVDHEVDRLETPTLDRLVRGAAGDEAVACLVDYPARRSPWGKPADFDALARRVIAARETLHRVADLAREVDRKTPWRLLRIRLETLAAVQYFLGNLLGVGEGGGNGKWTTKTREILQGLDGCLGRLIELADRRGAALLVVSPQGCVPFRERIAMGELLLRRDLLRVSEGPAALGYHLGRLAWRTWRRLPGVSTASRPAGVVLPVDWRRTRAVALHGQSAALVYLNTPERFGARVLASEASREMAALEVTAALADARHPVTEEPLFVDVFALAERFGVDPLARNLPDVIGVPAAGFHTRHRLDRKRRLVRGDRGLTCTPGGPGLMMVRSPGVVLGQCRTVDATEVLPVVWNLLDVEAGRSEKRKAESGKR